MRTDLVDSQVAELDVECHEHPLFALRGGHQLVVGRTYEAFVANSVSIAAGRCHTSTASIVMFSSRLISQPTLTKRGRIPP